MAVCCAVTENSADYSPTLGGAGRPESGGPAGLYSSHNRLPVAPVPLALGRRGGTVILRMAGNPGTRLARLATQRQISCACQCSDGGPAGARRRAAPPAWAASWARLGVAWAISSAIRAARADIPWPAAVEGPGESESAWKESMAGDKLMSLQAQVMLSSPLFNPST
jgi:hypothetical protein